MMEGILDMNWVRMAAEKKMTVVTMKGLGSLPRIFRISSATASPAPLFLKPVEMAVREPTSSIQFQSMALMAS